MFSSNSKDSFDEKFYDPIEKRKKLNIKKQIIDLNYDESIEKRKINLNVKFQFSTKMMTLKNFRKILKE